MGATIKTPDGQTATVVEEGKVKTHDGRVAAHDKTTRPYDEAWVTETRESGDTLTQTTDAYARDGSLDSTTTTSSQTNVAPAITRAAAEEGFMSRTVVYQCDDNLKLNVSYINRRAAEVTVHNETFQLKSAVTGSGARYTGEGYELATKNNDALFTSPITKKTHNCTTVN